MRLVDVSGCAQTSLLLAGMQSPSAKQSSGDTFWRSCAANLYTSAQCAPVQPRKCALTQFGGVAASSSSVPTLAGSLPARPAVQVSRSDELKGLPCPVLYQAKEPEAISDVLRRAGKKALGGGIPGE